MITQHGTTRPTNFSKKCQTVSNKASTDVDKILGRKLREFRESRKITQEGLGQQIGVSFQQVQKYEQGINRMSVSRLWEISCVLEVNINDFFTEIISTNLTK